MSNFAGKSEMTKMSKVAEVSPSVPVGDTSRAIQTFSMVFDRLYNQFSEQLVKEYAQMRNSYMVEYQSNLDQNTSRKEDKISEVSTEIQHQEESIQELRDTKKKQKSQIARFFKQKIDYYRVRSAYRTWEKLFKVAQQKNRVAAYTRNVMHRRKVKILFQFWRGVSHKWFKERLNREIYKYRNDLQSEKLNIYASKVDALFLYMAQLEEKIKAEAEAREHLTRTYETSLNTGVNKLNQETEVLAENPLVREISLIVARELLKKSQGNPDMTEMIR